MHSPDCNAVRIALMLHMVIGSMPVHISISTTGKDPSHEGFHSSTRDSTTSYYYYY
jgi:hypothetical protein